MREGKGLGQDLLTMLGILTLIGALVLVWITLPGCARKNPISASADSRLSQLQERYDEKLAEMQAIRDPATGWPSATDCDGMIWAGKYAASQGVTGVDILAAEYPDESGRFSRRPLPACWNDTDGDVGSKTTWSRDMATAGLIPWAFLTGNRTALERHAAYGLAHGWVMGEPLADGRTVYTPAIIGLLYQAIYALGGELSELAVWPNVYPAGLTGYKLHLQVSDIWLRGRIDTALGLRNSADAISQTMFERLEEAVQTEPSDPFYALALAEYTGDMSHTLDLLLDPAMPRGSYVRCDGDKPCALANWLFVASLAIDKLDPKVSRGTPEN